MANFFKLSKSTIIIDIIIFLIGLFLTFGFLTKCTCVGGGKCNCPQPFLFYVGIVFSLIAILRFLISLIILIITKFLK